MSSYGQFGYGYGHYGLDLVATTGRGRTALLEPALFRADRQNVIGEELSLLMLAGKVDMDLDREGSKMVFTGELRSGLAVEPLLDFVAPFIRITYQDGSYDYEQVGLYALLPTSGDYYPGLTRQKLAGVDLLWLLASDKIPATYNVALGVNYVTAAIAVLTAAGFTRINIPATSKTTPKALSWRPGASRLQIVNDLLTGCGYYNVWCDRIGQPTSFPYLELSTAQPAAFYTDTNSTVVPPVSNTPVITRLCNRVVVVGSDPATTPYVGLWENHDPLSPMSFENRGSIWIGREIQDSEIRTQAEADALARRYGEEGASYYRTLKLSTRPDPTRNPREIYQLDLTNPEGVVADGKWWCTGWSLPFDFTSKQVTMTHELNRVERYGVAA